MKEALYIIGDVIHALQKERGCSAMLLGSHGELFSDRIKRQFEASDVTIKALKDSLDNWRSAKSLDEKQINKLASNLDNFDELKSFRKKLVAQELTTSKTIDHYSHMLIGPLLQQMIEIALFAKGVNPVSASALNAFLHWKERLGLERAIGLRGFIAHNFQNPEFIERFLFLLSEQSNYQRTYLALANETQRELVQSVLQDVRSKKLEHLQELMSQSPETQELIDVSPEDWFDLVTAKIDALQTVMNQLIDTLYEPAPKTTTGEVCQVANNNNQSLQSEYTPLINSLQIFSGLSSASLNELMTHAQIRTVSKGKLLFLASEQANRLYIILKGWVKIFQGSVKGDETVLQMLSSGDAIMETAVLLNLSYPVSAQIAENATILSLPAPVFRERIKQDSDLATNFLTSMSYRSQGLINKMALSRLKTVDERVGWFLLKLALEQGHKTRYIDLPYEKSLIASYLDMKRETFSRALKRFKQKGFKIENNRVILPALTSLCEFCDQSLAEQCPRFNRDECCHYDFLKELEVVEA